MHIYCLSRPEGTRSRTDEILDALKNIVESEIAGEACLLNCGGEHIYLVHSTELDPYAVSENIPGFRNSSDKDILHDRDAVRRFLLDILGADTEQVGTPEALNSIRQDFTLCADERLPGNVLHKLFTRAEALSNKLRRETSLTEHAATPGEISRELAGKILEDLSSITVTVIGDREEFRDFVLFWDRQSVRSLSIIHPVFQRAEELSLTTGASPVQWQDKYSAMRKSDLIILLSDSTEPILTRDQVRQNLRERKRRHLIIQNWGEETATEEKLDRSNPVFFYTRTELTGLVKKGIDARNAVLKSNESTIQSAIDGFYDWLYSGDRFQFQNIVGRSREMQHVFDLVRRVAETDITVLIEGETGTGKELVAQAIHKLSSRRSGEFVPVNCGAIPETLLESELFGHEKGAFTGAHQARTGLLREASGGTVLLDEIGNTTAMFQIKLLRALQEREITPLGSNHPQSIDVRIIAATSKNLAEEVERGAFRSDLYYRVNVVKIEIPPLRDRREDIIPLTRFFMERYNTRMGKKIQDVSPAVKERLLSYHWPGNVRELENAIERAIALTLGNEITLEDLPDQLTKNMDDRSAGGDQDVRTLEEVERDHIRRLLEHYPGNYDEIANQLGIGRTTLWRKMKKYGLSED